MKKIIRYAGLMILAFSALSCTDSRVSGDRRYGYLTVGVSDELDDLVHLKSGEEEEIVYRLDLYYSDDVLAKTIEDHRTVTEEEPIELLMDKYRVTAKILRLCYIAFLVTDPHRFRRAAENSDSVIESRNLKPNHDVKSEQDIALFINAIGF